jgi:hypothetical protein
MYTMARPSFIYINGYPGVGKLTVARALWYGSTVMLAEGSFLTVSRQLDTIRGKALRQP